MRELKAMSHVQNTISKPVTISGNDWIITGVTYDMGSHRRTLAQLKTYHNALVGPTVCELNREDVAGTSNDSILRGIRFTFSNRIREFKRYTTSQV